MSPDMRVAVATALILMRGTDVTNEAITASLVEADRLGGILDKVGVKLVFWPPNAAATTMAALELDPYSKGDIVAQDALVRDILAVAVTEMQRAALLITPEDAR